MERTYIGELKSKVGGTAKIQGWISVARNQGKMVFFDVRDMTGSVQATVLSKSPAIDLAKTVSRESAVTIIGPVNARPEKNITSDKQNGDIEMLVEELIIENLAQPIPFEVSEDTQNISEEARLKYRYLDLRSERMQKNLRTRSEMVRRIREFLFTHKFAEIETPMLTESTPEGSRDFVVPSRLHPGKFYALPQSPQQYKQLLMAGGIERYFQIARCIRDEDLRADRGFEFTQLDLEMSFVSQDDIMDLMEAMIIAVVEGMGYTIKQKPFPRFTYAEAMEKYGADKFDMRTEDDKARNVLAFAWVYKFPFFEKTADGAWTFTHNPFSMALPEHQEMLLNKENIGDILTTQYDMVCNGYEVGGGSIRAHKPELLKAAYEIMGNTMADLTDKVGHMLEAFTYGTPPHGGIAFGIERLVMILVGTEFLREVQAFPMTRGGQTAVMNAPKPLVVKQLIELGIKIDKKEEKA